MIVKKESFETPLALKKWTAVILKISGPPFFLFNVLLRDISSVLKGRERN